MIKIFKHLLPTGRAWRLTIDKPLRRLVEGLSSAAQDARDYIDSKYLDLFPPTSTTLEDWGAQFGVAGTEQAVAAAWKATGGQSTGYVQDILRANGFNVTLHPFWVPGSSPPAGQLGAPRVRNPNFFLYSPDWIGEPIYTAGDPQVTAGAGATAGATTQKTDRPGYTLVDGINSYQPQQVAARWPYYVYVGAETFPQLAAIPFSRRAEFERLLLQHIPGHLWIGALVEYTGGWYDANGVLLCGATINNCEDVIPC